MAKGTKVLNRGIKVDNGRNVFVRVRGSEPPDASVAQNEMVFWFDGGAAKIKVKHRSGLGAVKTGDVADLT